MNMVIRNISEAKAELSALIEEVAKGNEVILAKAGKPVARVVPYSGAAAPVSRARWRGKSGSLPTSIPCPMIWPKPLASRPGRNQAPAGHPYPAVVGGQRSGAEAQGAPGVR